MYLNDNLITVYTDNQISKYICYNFALGSKSVMRHVDELTEFENKFIATYGYLRGTGEIIKGQKIFSILTMVILSNLIENFLIRKQKF